MLADADAAKIYIWVQTSETATQRKLAFERYVNAGINGVNLRSNQKQTVSNLTATIGKNEVLRLIEIRKREQGYNI